jgi:hypothetical protein
MGKDAAGGTQIAGFVARCRPGPARIAVLVRRVSGFMRALFLTLRPVEA